MKLIEHINNPPAENPNQQKRKTKYAFAASPTETQIIYLAHLYPFSESAAWHPQIPNLPKQPIQPDPNQMQTMNVI